MDAAAAGTSPDEDRIETVAVPLPDDARLIGALLETAAREDGREAVSEQGRLHLRAERAGVRHLLQHDGYGTLVGYAQLDGSAGGRAPVVELVVDPSHRGRGHGRVLARAAVAEAGGAVRLWAHGGHPAARHLAESLGLELFRELRQLRRPLPPAGPALDAELPQPPLPEGVSVRTFRPGEDDEAWLRLNAAAFAHHPEQGAWTARDLAERLDEPWFDPAGFFLAVRDTPGGEALVGFHWTKVAPRTPGQEQVGEVYVLGVDPAGQGGGLGRALTAVGLRHLAADRGLRTAVLYVDADNPAALRVYERMGFATHEVDLMYRTPGA
ncbi:mycothiol synthase [Streptacidiphilus sp. ASG 303]|uniref:mycothiol synthase n=1 Tax=Streptacidiphilus sp. ASG 303 TaxID=2896847 RepID=UPI001E65B7E5|nr:mycothiol synthase [Streptacidiphilus sp. ASG 303]MCD0485601.1 mycothiol synthase [Streptacidiphilus sp. ASG 303]